VPPSSRRSGLSARKTLAFTGVALLALSTALPAVAGALPSQEQPLLSAGQTMRVPAYVQPELVARDAFGISTFSVVQWPVAAGTPISSYYGYRSCAGCTTNHTGIDFTPGSGADIHAVADGVVVEAGYAADYGVYVVLQHDLDGEIVQTLYAHMQDDGAMTATVGQSLPRGTVLGHVGQTGQATGPHLHFAVRYGEQDFVDPYPWLLTRVNI
jgi:murein DD-endopeptidase MepM/ murein hydrolase activator NlpD